MDIVFLSNFYNHHQKPLCEALSATPGVTFTFVETEPMSAERRQLGYQRLQDPFVLRAYEAESAAECRSRILSADVLLAGSCPEEMLRARIRAGKLIFRYSERPLKNGPEVRKYLVRFLRWHARNPRSKPIYLLCASAFASRDYAMFGLFRNRAFKWGYFPACRTYSSPDVLLRDKEAGRILWCGRLISWKHPEHALDLAERLPADWTGTVDLIGTGEMEAPLRQEAVRRGLTDRVRFLGAMSPAEVRGQMERAEIFILTSDRREGWGAVLNEAMNSACAVAVSDQVGSAPYLIEHGSNGLVYPSGDTDELTKAVRGLLEDPALRERCALGAYQTIRSDWNAQVAAERLVRLSERLLRGEDAQTLYPDGICSRA